MSDSVSLELSALLRAVRLVDRHACTQTTQPAFAACHLQAGLNALTVAQYGVDSALSLQVRADAAPSDKPLDVATNARALFDVLRKIPRGSLVDLRTDESGRLVIASGRARYQIATLEVDQLPRAGAYPVSGAFYLESADLVALLSRVAPAISDDPTRPYLGGAFLHADGEKVRAVATNGHLMISDAIASADGAAMLATLEARGDMRPGFMIPGEQVDMIARAFADGLADGVAVVSIGPDHWQMTAGALSFKGRAVDGIFPDYARVVPDCDPLGAWNVSADAAAAFYVAQGGKGAHKRGTPAAGVIARYIEGAPLATCRKVDGAAPLFVTAPGDYVGADLVKGLQPVIARTVFDAFAGLEVRADVRADPFPFVLRSEGAPDRLAVAMPVSGAFLDPVATVEPFAPTFPGMAADLVGARPLRNGADAAAVRVAHAEEIKAYCRDLAARAGLPIVGAIAWTGIGLGRAALVGGLVGGKRGAPYIDGSYSLLIPGGARNGERVTFETVDPSGAVLDSTAMTLGDKRAAGLPIDAATVLAASGLVEVAKGRRPRRAVIAPAPRPAAVETAPPVEVEAPAPVELAPVRIANGVDNWRPVDALRHHVSGAIERGEAVAIVAVEAAPVADAVDLVAVEDAPAMPVEAPQDSAPAPEPVAAPASDVADLQRRLAAIEAALGLVALEPVAKRTASHARAVRLAWRNRRQERAERRAHDAALAALATSERNREEYRERFANAEARNCSLASSLQAANARCAQAMEQAERALRERDGARLESAERADLVAAVDAARADAANENRNAVKVAHVMRRRYVQFATAARGAAKARAELARTRAERDGIAANLGAMSRRAVEDAALIERLRPASLAPIADETPRRFILASR